MESRDSWDSLLGMCIEALEATVRSQSSPPAWLRQSVSSMWSLLPPGTWLSHLSTWPPLSLESKLALQETEGRLRRLNPGSLTSQAPLPQG